LIILFLIQFLCSLFFALTEKEKNGLTGMFRGKYFYRYRENKKDDHRKWIEPNLPVLLLQKTNSRELMQL
jgi:hypothetical protein